MFRNKFRGDVSQAEKVLHAYKVKALNVVTSEVLFILKCIWGCLTLDVVLWHHINLLDL